MQKLRNLKVEKNIFYLSIFLGDFRTHHTRITNHAEEIAFYGGSEREKEIVNDSYFSIVKLSEKQHFLQCLMGFLDSYLGIFYLFIL